MRLPSYHGGAAESELLTIDQAVRIFNLGENRVRALAEQAAAVRKIGRSVRINKRLLSEYIDREFCESSRN